MLENLGMLNSTPGVPGGQPALTCIGICSSKSCHTSTCLDICQSSSPTRSTCLDRPQPAPTCLGIQSPGGCHASACLGICTLTCRWLALRLQQYWVGTSKDSPLKKSTHGNWRRAIQFFFFFSSLSSLSF